MTFGGFSSWANGIDDYFQSALTARLVTFVSLPRGLSLVSCEGESSQQRAVVHLANRGEFRSSL